MKIVKSLLAVALAAVLFNGFVVAVSASTAEANANAEVTCETGTYGQNVNCKANSNASAKAVVTRAGVPTHKVASTAVDAQGIAMIVGTLATGAAATIARFRLSK